MEAAKSAATLPGSCAGEWFSKWDGCKSMKKTCRKVPGGGGAGEELT